MSDNKNIQCPNCKQLDSFKILHSDNNNIDNVTHFHLTCEKCGLQFNLWNNNHKIKEIYGMNYGLYQ